MAIDTPCTSPHIRRWRRRSTAFATTTCGSRSWPVRRPGFYAGANLRGAASGQNLSLDERPPFCGITRDYFTDKPIIAAVNGVAVGGGLELALAADIAVASGNARVGLSEPRVAVLAGAGWDPSARAPGALKKAMRRILTGRLIDAREAHRIGCSMPSSLPARPWPRLNDGPNRACNALR